MRPNKKGWQMTGRCHCRTAHGKIANTKDAPLTGISV